MPIFSSHYCKGRLPVAFVLSVPGKAELESGKPTSGDTGENLNAALILLNQARPALFSSLDCFHYRITNAFPVPLAVSLGHSVSEAKKSEILNPKNVERVLQEIEGCSHVILCGKKAGLLSSAVMKTEKIVIVVPHVGNKGLNNTYRFEEDFGATTQPERRHLRIELWAGQIVAKLAT